MKNLISLLFGFFCLNYALFSQVSITATAQNATCSANGTITVTVSGGSMPYDFMLDGITKATASATSQILTGLSAGTYLLQVLDNTGIPSNSISVTVGGNYEEPTLTCVYANCEIVATVSHGTAPFQYAISAVSASGPYSPYQTSNVFTTVPLTNTCYVRVKDSCENIYTAVVSLNLNSITISINCSAIDSVHYNIGVNASGGQAPYSFTCIAASGAIETNTTGIFDSLMGCNYKIIITDFCEHKDSMVNSACLYPQLSLDCVDCETGTLNMSGTGGTAPYIFYANAGNGFNSSSTTGNFAGLPSPYNGQYYTCNVQDACGAMAYKHFYCLTGVIDCEGLSGFNGQVNFAIDPDYLATNPNYPITLNCAGCTPSTVTITSASQFPILFDGLMSGIQMITMTDDCDNVFEITSNCELGYTINMQYTPPGGGVPGSGGPSGSGQALSCGNTLVLAVQTPGLIYNLYNLATGALYASNATGIFAFIPPDVYEIQFISATGFLIHKDTFDTSIFFTDFQKDCRNLFVGACPDGLIFALHDVNGVPLVTGDTTGIFLNLTTGQWYQVWAKDTISLKSISQWVLMDSIGRLEYDIVNCRDLDAVLTLPQNPYGDTIVTYTLTGVNTAYSQQNQTGDFLALANGTYTLMVTRGNCDTVIRQFTIGTPFNPYFCVNFNSSSSTFSPFTWSLQTNPPNNIHYSLLNSNGISIPFGNGDPDYYTGLAPGHYTITSPDCEMYDFDLPNFPDTTLNASVSSFCSNLACIHPWGGMEMADWQAFAMAHNLNFCYFPHDSYNLYLGNTFVASGEGDFCDLTSGGNYMVILVRGLHFIDTVYLEIPNYMPPNLNGTMGTICNGNLYANISLTLDGNGKPFTYNLLNPPSGYSPTQITTDSTHVLFPNLPPGQYQFMVYDDCGASSDFTTTSSVLTINTTWSRFCDGTIQLFAPNFPDWQYCWVNSAGDTIGNVYNPTTINTNAGTYTLTVNAAGCTYIQLTNVPAANISPNDSLVNAGSDASFPYSYQAISANGSLKGSILKANETCQWMQIAPNPSNATILTPTQPNTDITVYAPGLYTFVYLIYYETCVRADTVQMRFFDCGESSMELQSTPEGCKNVSKNGTATVKVNGGTGPYTYSWSNGELGKTAHHLQTGNYTVYITDKSGCLLKNAVTAAYTTNVSYVSEQVNANFTSLPTNIKPLVLDRDTIQFLNASQNATAYSWSFLHLGNVATSTDINPIHILADTGLWKVTLYAYNDFCWDTYSLIYHIIPNGSIFIANAFTPNADGNNDTFGPIGAHITDLSFTIYDRWGKVIYNTTNVGTAWDGTFKGEGVPEGVYTFLLRANLENGLVINRGGTVTLLR